MLGETKAKIFASMNKLRVVYFIMFLWSCKGEAQVGELSTVIDNLITEQSKQGKFDGTILVANKDSIIFQKAFGLADRVWNIPTQIDSKYDIASLNKSFVAVLILQQVEKGNLDLNQRVVDFIPDFKVYNYDQVTIHQLLTHTGGLPDYGELEAELQENNFRKFKRLHFTNKEYIAFIGKHEPVSEPGTNFYYSNFGYHILSILLETITGNSFAELLNQEICVPLNLNNTFSPSSNEAIYEGQVEAYNLDPNDGQFKRNQFIDFTLGRRIYSTVGDLYKWSMALNDPGKILSKNYLKLLKTNHLVEIESNVSYGYGWYVFDGGEYGRGNLNIDKNYIIHGGSTEGFKSMLTIIEGNEFIITHLSNIGNQTNEFKLTSQIIHKLIKEE